MVVGHFQTEGDARLMVAACVSGCHLLDGLGRDMFLIPGISGVVVLFGCMFCVVSKKWKIVPPSARVRATKGEMRNIYPFDGGEVFSRALDK